MTVSLQLLDIVEKSKKKLFELIHLPGFDQVAAAFQAVLPRGRI